MVDRGGASNIQQTAEAARRDTPPRETIARAIAEAERALAVADSPRASAAARVALARAHAARAEDSRHGAGQLSLGAQRAPTCHDCDDGWERVESIVVVAETSARVAARLAEEVERDAPGSASARAARIAATRAASAANAARRIVHERNDAYTFHASASFSFGEGWYVAAAGVLAGIAVQVESGQSGTAAAEWFLREAGLSAQLRPRRSRPRAVKQTTAIVADAFRRDPRDAQRRLRAAFLGAAPIAASIVDWADRRLAGAGPSHKVLLWVRDGIHDGHRNTSSSELEDLARRALSVGLVPIAIGDAPKDPLCPGVVDLTLFWKEPLFRGEDSRRAQLQLFEHLTERHALVGQIGVTTAGMDGPALMGLATLYLTDATNPRMQRWVDAVPGYREIVRDGTHDGLVDEALAEWARATNHRQGRHPVR